jgi:hypothetical protein
MFYQPDGKVESHIEADYALFFEKQELWEARNNVVAKNESTNEQLFTEHIFWNQKEEKIYSDQFTKIIKADGTFTGEKGFEARQDLTKWKLFRSKGTVNVKDQMQEPETHEYAIISAHELPGNHYYNFMFPFLAGRIASLLPTNCVLN